MNPWADTLAAYQDGLGQTIDEEVPSSPRSPLNVRSRIPQGDKNILALLMGQQQEGVEQQRALADEVASRPQQMDFSPMLGLVDQWTGSKFADNYKKPMTADEKAMLVSKLRGIASDDQAKVTDAQSKFMLGEDANLMKELVATLRKGGGSGDDIKIERLDWDKQKEITNDIQKISNPFEKRVEELDQLGANLALNKYGALASSLSLFSRQISGEKGVLTEEDVKRSLPKNLGTDWARIVSYFNDADAEISPEIAKGMRKLVRIARSKTYEKYKRLTTNQLQTYRNTPSLRRLTQTGGLDSIYKPTIDSIEAFAPIKRPASIPEDQWDDLSDEGQLAAIDLLKAKAATAPVAPKKGAKK